MEGVGQETKNKILYKNIVKNHFSLSEESQKLFKHRLFFERDIAPEYKQLIKDSPDLRARFEFDPNNSRYSGPGEDKGWEIFREVFSSFRRDYNVSYEDFARNKIEVNGNDVKISKLLKTYYNDSAKFEFLLRKILFDTDIMLEETMSRGNVIKRLHSTIKSEIPAIEEESENIHRLSATFNTLSFKITVNSVFELEDLEARRQIITTAKINKEQMERLVNKFVNIVNEVIGEYKMPKRDNLQLVVSLNPVDWFLCSTGQASWSSCLSLAKDGEVFWMGLPYLIGDKSRALVYITDGTKKRYMGMEVDSMLSRSWMLLLRYVKTKETYWHFVKEYPNNYGLKNIFEKLTDTETYTIDQLEDMEINFNKLISKYYFEFLYMRSPATTSVVKIPFIYFDTGRVKIAKKNKARHFPFSYGYYRMDDVGPSGLFIDIEGRVEHLRTNEEMPSLDMLVEEQESIAEHL